MGLCRCLIVVVAVLGTTTGCMSDEVVYVDSAGNELAVDQNGKPILPRMVVAPVAPVRAETTVDRARPPAARAQDTGLLIVSERPSSMPPMDPTWTFPRPDLTTAAAPATPTRILTSADLGTPPTR